MLWHPDFNCFGSFILSRVDKVTTRTLDFVSVIAKVVYQFVSQITKFIDYVKLS